jgi:hypothetical protein
MKHDELVNKTAKWLRKHSQNIKVPNCPFILTELVSNTTYGEIPDVIGFGFRSVMIEVKVSRSDFLTDKKKMCRKYENWGMGELRYYCCPENMIKVEELPDKWGLLYLTGKRIKLIKNSELHEAHIKSERTMLLSVMRRTKEQLKEL